MDLSWLDEVPAFDRNTLSLQAQRGLSAARYMRDRDFRGNDFGDGIRDWADNYGVDQSTVRRWIAKAQRELTQPERACAEAGCAAPLPRGSRRSRKFCEQHATAAARVRRHRGTSSQR